MSLKIENVQVEGWEAAIRGMRNPMNSWDKMDSGWDWIPEEPPMTPDDEGWEYVVGPNDHKLMMSLAKGGPVHAKYRRMIVVYADITAPLYWWKEFDTYKVGTVANSCSTMHKIHAKEFTLDDFSKEHLLTVVEDPDCFIWCGGDKYDPIDNLYRTVKMLNKCRKLYLETKDKRYWWQMIQLLPTSYNQKRTVMLNYEVLHNIYHSRRHHKLDEWHVVCDWIEKLPYSEIIVGESNEL